MANTANEEGSSVVKTLEDLIGLTPLVALQHLPEISGNKILAKLEGNNPAGSVKDRPALYMIKQAEQKGIIKPGDTLIEATSGNTGIALAMVASFRGYRMILIMPEHLSIERRQAMRAFGAEILLVTKEQGMEGARDLAIAMERAGQGIILDQFNNPDNPLAHYETTGPEIWQATQGKVTHFVATMGTTGTIMGVSRYLKEQNPSIKIIGVQPADGANVPGIRKWPAKYLPKFYDERLIDTILEVTQQAAEDTMRRLAREEGIFVGVSSGGGCWAALEVSHSAKNAVIVYIACDRGDRYLSTGVFPA